MSKKSLKVEFNKIIKKLDFPDSFDDLIKYISTNFPKDDDVEYKLEEEKTSKEILSDEDKLYHMKVQTKLLAKKNSTANICKILLKNNKKK